MFQNGKHVGKSLGTVGQKDPGYLRWAWRQMLPDDQHYAIEDVANVLLIDLDPKPQRPRRSMHITKQRR